MSDRKKILLLTRPICPPWDEGSKNFAYTLAKHLPDFEIHLLACLQPRNRVSTWKPSFQVNVVYHNIYTSSKWDFWQKIRAYVFLIREFLIKGGKNYDVLHSFFTPTRLNTFALKLCLRNKKIKTIQTLATLRDDLYSKERLKKIIHTDFIITYSDYAKEKLKKMGFRNIRRIYPGIDFQKFSPAPKKLEMMRKFGIRQDDFVINFTGEFARLGAIDDVVASFLDLAKKFPNFKLFLACRIKGKEDRMKKEEVEEKIKQLGFLNRVAFAFDQSYEMEDIYNLCDVSIFPVRNMTGKFDIPLAVIEAMACGKPVIASNLERLRYFLNDENSILIDPGNRQALKEKILYLYENSKVRRELGGKGMKFARENFDIMKVVEEYKSIYEKIVENKHSIDSASLEK